MPSEQLRFWIEIVASFAGIVALFAIAMELVRARRADTRDFLFNANEKLNAISSERLYTESMEFSNLEDWAILVKDDKHWKKFLAVFNFWELIATATKLNAINKNLVLYEYGVAFMHFYEKFSTVYHELDKNTGFNMFEELDWFANEFMGSQFSSRFELGKKANDYVNKVIAQASK